MLALPHALKRTALALGAITVLAAAWYFGSQREVAATTSAPPAPVAPVASVPAASVVTATEALSTIRANTPASASTASMPAPLTGDDDLSNLRIRALLVPVQGTTAAQLSDTFTQARAAGASHEAIDIMAAKGTPVLAVEDGKLVKLFLSQAGGLTLYQFDPSNTYAYYYAHLDRYADGIAEGASLKKGQLLGYVGSTGNASPDAPHLHFAIFKLGPEREWWRGVALNPYPVWRDGP